MARNDLPNPNAANFGVRLREAVMTYLGRTGDPLDRGLTLRDMVDNGLVRLRQGFSLRTGYDGALPIEPGPTIIDAYEPNLTPPPVPTGFTVSAGINVLFIEHDAPQYTQGHGHLRTRVYGKIVNQGDPLPVFADAIEITQFTGTVHSYPSNPSTQWRLWIKWETADGVLSVSPAGGTNGLAAGTTTIRGVDLGPLIVEAGNLASGAVTATKLAAEAVSLTSFASGIEPVTVVQGSTVPTVKSTNTIYLAGEGKLYRWDGAAYTAAVPAADLSGTIVEAQIADGSVVASKIADAALTTAKFASGIEPVGVVSVLPAVSGYTGPKTVMLTTDSKLYRFTGTAWTAVVEPVDIDSRGLDIKDITGNVIFASDGEIAPTAYVDVNSNNVLISEIAANSLVPSLNYVGAFSTAPTSQTLGSAWKQNAVYKNTLNGQSYVLTGTPLAWVEYLADGQLFLLTIESTNGTIFRVGQSTSTSLHARLFKNGAEVTSETPASWFRWRRVSAIPQAPPNDDATWNANYVSGFKSVSVNVDSVFARATFFCDIIET